MLVKKQVVLTGEYISDAAPGFDNQTSEPVVHINLDGRGARIFRDTTRENVGKRMAILLIEKGQAEVITAPVIREEIGGGRVQITGAMTTQEANDVALLLRAGALAAPMEIIEERTVGPSMGAENIAKGFNSNIYGFIAIAVFMIDLLPLLRHDFHHRAERQPAVPGGLAVAAAGHADPARHGGYRAHDRHGDRRQRADQRAHPRGTAQRHLAAGGHPCRLRARLRHHSGLQHHHLHCRRCAVLARLRPGARFCGGVVPRHPDLDVQRRGGFAQPGQPELWPQGRLDKVSI